MTKRAWWLGMLVWSLVLPAAGCDGGKGCEQLCDAREACPDVIPSETSCADQCVQQAKIVKAGECETVQAAYEECLNATADVCDAQDCNTEALAAGDCIQDYCEANPGECGG